MTIPVDPLSLRLLEGMAASVAVRLDAAAKAPGVWERELHVAAARGIADAARGLAWHVRLEGRQNA